MGTRGNSTATLWIPQKPLMTAWANLSEPHNSRTLILLAVKGDHVGERLLPVFAEIG